MIEKKDFDIIRQIMQTVADQQQTEIYREIEGKVRFEVRKELYANLDDIIRQRIREVVKDSMHVSVGIDVRAKE